MNTLERISELKKTGIPESEIISRLKNEGIKPMEINDALNQSKIKEAVAGEGENDTKGMVPSIMDGNNLGGNSNEEEAYSPNSYPENAGYEENSYGAPSPQTYSQNRTTSYEPEEYYENEYPQENYGGSYSSNPDTMIEISEQVFFEKSKKLDDEIRKLKEFMVLSSPLIKDLHERVKRIEKNFDKMQLAILDKVGSFGKNIDSLKQEIEMVENSFEKMNKTNS